MKNFIIGILAIALTASLIVQWRSKERSGVAPRYAEIAETLVHARHDPALAGAAIGFCLLDGNGEVVLDENAQTAFIPASSLKTLTTATALEVLGPEFRIKTELRATAVMVHGEITGDIVIVGGADPMLAMKDLEAWAVDLKKRGLVRVTGRVIGDGRLLHGSIYDDFWNWGDIGNGYGSAVAGLNLEHNRFVAVLQPGTSLNSPAALLRALPDVPGVSWINEVTTGASDSGDGVVIHGGERTHTLYLRGSVPLGAGEFTVTGAVPDPELFAAHHLRRVLLAAGIEVVGAAESVSGKAPPPDAPHVLLKHASPLLLDIITSIHATSDNHETECLFRILGLRAGKAPDAVVREHWRARGLDFTGLRMEDGCGLARADFVRPLDLARLQYLAGRGPHGSAYKNSLLSDGALRWKGGAMSGVRTVTGYVTGRSGEEFCFALMVNHHIDADAVTALRHAVTEATHRL